MNSDRTRGRLSRLRRLPVQDRRVLLNALFLLPLNAMGLRLIGYRRWLALLSWGLPRDRRPVEVTKSDSSARPQRIAQLVYAASREGAWTGACLERALALWWMLRRRNFAAEIRIGARKEGERFEAHAWVQLDGAVLNDEEALLDFVPFENSAPISGVKLP